MAASQIRILILILFSSSLVEHIKLTEVNVRFLDLSIIIDITCRGRFSPREIILMNFSVDQAKILSSF